MTPPDVVEVINTIAAYLIAEGYRTVVISDNGGATFDRESILTRQERLYRVIDTLHTSIEVADFHAATLRRGLGDVKDTDSVYKAIAEWQAQKEQATR